ncbi:PREDICTED: hemicentin-1-like, partial [Thamnophis sirtalis]|uniref:Hemicentin-1-like n=1 Tax=Thamnophis sirtalis TaxID=35019 RepID=A0A6I9YXS0_9SAUR
MAVHALSWDTLIAKLQNHYAPTLSHIAQHYAFWQCIQKDTETISQFLASLRTAATQCKFPYDSLLEQFVCGVQAIRIKQRLLACSDINLQMAMDEARAAELSDRSMAEIQKCQQYISPITRIFLIDELAPLDDLEEDQVNRLKTQPSGPSQARGSVIGHINDVEFGIAVLNATVIDGPDEDITSVEAKITNIPWNLGPVMRVLVSILSPIYWITAKEIGEAVNGFSLTSAVFKRETQVEFATGELVRMTHVARGLDSDGYLLLDVVISGHILPLQSTADVNVKDYTEDYIQTGPGQLYAYSTRLFSIDGVSLPYTWNHTITYDQNRGKMPFLVETLQASSIKTEYSPHEEALTFKIAASITKGDHSNQCPDGFLLDSSGPYCSDEDECITQKPCSHICHNVVGTYYCSCPKGLTISADGRACQDIDECALGRHSCMIGQDCENVIGSYRCVIQCGIGFRRTPDGLSCQDVNECQESHPCH